MRTTLFAIALLCLLVPAAAAGGPRAFTYSIVAWDAETGQLGVAVQSHWFSVGPIVPWAESGVGAVATQSIADPSYGPLGLDLMRSGKTAPQALRALLAGDPTPQVRQVAMVDASGRTAVHTGGKCIPAAGHVRGEGFTVQANLMGRDTVWGAMADAYRQATGDLAERMLAALEAAESEGGDIRGRQSAAILVVHGTPSGRPWLDRLFDLRVEDHPEPLAELRRLVRLRRAYIHAEAGDEAMAEDDVERALDHYAEAARIAPEILELPYWQAVTLASTEHLEEALPIFRRVFREEPRWIPLTKRLPETGFLAVDDAALSRILETAASSEVLTKTQ